MDLPPLEEILERAKAIYNTSKGFGGNVQVKLNIIEKEYQVLALAEEGVSSKEISLRTGFSYSTIKGWISGNRMPMGIARVLKPVGPQNKFQTYGPPNVEDINLAYILGFFIGNTAQRTKFKHTLTCPSFDSIVLNRVKESIENEFGRDLIRNEEDRICFQSSAVARYFYEVSRGYSELPWEHICTDQEKIGFVRGFIDSRVHPVKYKVKRKYIALHCLGKPVLVEQVLVLCGDLGIYFCLGSESGRHLLLSSPRSAKALLKYDLVHGKNAILAKEISKKESEHTTTLECYLTYRKLKSQGLDKSEICSKICSEYSYSKDTVRSWFEGTIPNIVKYYNTYMNLKNRYSYGYVINYLYREMGIKLNPRKIGALAKRIKYVDNIKELHKEFIERSVPKKDYLSVIQSKFPMLPGGGVVMF